MAHAHAQIYASASVLDEQQARGSAAAQARRRAEAGPNDRLGPREMDYLAARDSLYLATVSADGWPYVQHRGGPPGFLRVLDAQTLLMADRPGNRQHLSAGHLQAVPRAALILVDYPNQRRLKLVAEVALLRPDEAPPAARDLPGLDGAERLLRFHLRGFDWNCSQFITPRYRADEWRAAASDAAPRCP